MTHTTTVVPTLRDAAFQAIARFYRKIASYKNAVLADTDPEPLHQMRVWMRRMRSGLLAFDAALDLPKAMQPQQIGRIARLLGSVRDLDVLGDRLESTYAPDLPPSEQRVLDRLRERLARQRRREFARMKTLLSSQNSSYQRFCSACERWLQAPRWQAAAAYPIPLAVPDALLAVSSDLLRHPGWLAGITWVDGRPLAAEDGMAVLQQHGEVLHDLRKHIKRARYQTECLTKACSLDLGDRLREFEAAQEALGAMQDNAVLYAFLVQHLRQPPEILLPTLVQRLQAEQNAVWARWRDVQQRFLEPAFRAAFRHALSLAWVASEYSEKDSLAPAT